MDKVVNVTWYLVRLIPWTANILLGWFFALVGLLPGFGGRGVFLPDNDESLPRTRPPARTRELDPHFAAGLRGDHHGSPTGSPAHVGLISRGVAIRNLKTSSPRTVVLPSLRTTDAHTVLSTDNGGTAGGQGSTEQGDHHLDCVFMPFADEAKCRDPTAKGWTGRGNLVKKWPVIQSALRKPINDFTGLKDVIMSYNDTCPDLDGLRDVLDSEFDNKVDFYTSVLPKMAKLALRLPDLCSQPIPLLRKGVAHSITLSQEQAACLLANAFFLTFSSGYGYQSQSDIPGMDFRRLYEGGIPRKTQEKVKCLLHYFRTVTEDMPQGNITYSRQMVTRDKLPKWEKCRDAIPQLHVSSGGTIEDDGEGMLQVDFANKYIGGGVLGRGCVQEEIRFVICPELLLSLLFTEVLTDNEAVVITGSQRYSDYRGYATSFEWAGGHDDTIPRDSWGRRCTQVVAIDAVNVKHNVASQFGASQMRRELNKAYVGFYDPYDQRHKTAVATGNWGCGAFGGDTRLKALIQLMAAAVAEREVCYFTYKDNKLTQDIYDIHKFITDHGLTVGDLWVLISQYNPNTYSRGHKKNVFESIQEQMASHPMPHITPSPEPASMPHITPSPEPTSKPHISPSPEPASVPHTATVKPDDVDMNWDDEDIWNQSADSDKKTTSCEVKKGTDGEMKKGTGDDEEKGTGDDEEKGTGDDMEKPKDLMM